MIRIKVLVIFGGQSSEHEVSIVSANSVLDALDRNKYDVQTIGISKDGKWYWGVEPKHWLKQKGEILPNYKQVTLVLNPQDPKFIALDGNSLPNDGKTDIIIPVLHGPKGEDGTIQGLFEIAGLPYVGSGVLGSALGMDKDRMKAVFREAGLPIVPHCTIMRSELTTNLNKVIEAITKQIGFPCFIKPANLGSSVGISKARNEEELIDALQLAAQFDRKLIVEKGVEAREIEVSVLGNDEAKASLPGEIIPSKEFYDYDAKYNDTGSKLIIPAELDPKVVKLLQEYAVKAFYAVAASGLGRVDFFVTADNEIFVNEINTMPGFTPISMYPKLWAVSGLAYAELIDTLIKLGLESYEEKRSLRV
ncbi:MAG TPA: D-alanine--D-alanine ligase [Peptococcaceae bacterium]|nr:D-alanine--D-alanine ligase [Peptococcaceae bacterium]